jgi:hypothetical protein
MLVFERFSGDQSSLMSKRYDVDTGWEDNATVIEPIFNADTSRSGAPVVSKAVLGVAMHGCGNATLITGERVGFPDSYGVGHDVRVQAREYEAGLGWIDSVATAYGGEIYRRPTIDQSGNAAYLTCYREESIFAGYCVAPAFLMRYE